MNAIASRSTARLSAENCFLYICLPLLLLAALPAQAQKVKVQHDPVADFSHFHTYAWKRGDVPAPHPGTDQLIVNSVDKKLAGKGFRRLSEGEPDFYVIYSAALGGAIAATTYEYAWPDWLSSGQYPTGPSDVYLKGTLVIDVVDARTKQIVWRGTASDTLEGVGEKVAKKVEKAVDKLLKEFPPPKGK